MRGKWGLAGLAVAVVGAMLVSPVGASHLGSGFGSQVHYGDGDFVPTLAALPGANAPFVCQTNFGDPSSIADDGFYLVFRSAAPAAGSFPVNNDLRLVPPAGMGKAPGTLVADADTIEKASGFALACWAPAFGAIDVNTNGRHDLGDWLVLDSGVAGTLLNAPPGAAAGFTPGDIRLTRTDAFNAGTLVQPANSDVVARGGALATGEGFPPLSVRWFDHDHSATFNGLQDRLYISSSGGADGALVAVNDVRLYGASGEFGTPAGLGDADFLPTVAPLPAANSPFVCQLGLGDPGTMADDGFYLAFRAAAPAAGSFLANNDLRLVAVAGRAAGTALADVDTAEKTAALAAACFAPSFGVVDTNTNGRYDRGDWVVLDTGSGAVMNPPPGAAAGFTPGDIRLTNTTGLLAGTVVLPGHGDVVAHGGPFAAGAGFPPLAPRWFDSDNSGTYNGLFDHVYASTAPAAAGTTVAVHDLRLFTRAGAFGSQVIADDVDYVPPVAPLPPAQLPFVCQLNLGDPSSVADDGFYLAFRFAAPAAGASLLNNDLRVVPPPGLGKLPGTVLADGDTVEKSTAFARACFAPSFGVVDTTTDGRYGPGDWILLDTGAAANLANPPAGTAAGFTPGDLRLTATTSGFGAGTLVVPGQGDVTAWGGPFAAGPGFPALEARWSDQDRSGTFNGLFDRLYVSSAPAGSSGLARPADVRAYALTPGGAVPPTPVPPPTTQPSPAPPPPTPGPVARIAPIAASECERLQGTVRLDATGSSGPAGSALRYAWGGAAVFGNASAPITTALVPFGATAVTLEVTDGNTTDLAEGLARVVDSLAPASTLAVQGLPGDAGWWRSAANAVVQASDRCGLGPLDVLLDGTPVPPAFVVAADGVHLVQHHATDRAGNTEPRQSATVRVDTVPPTTRLELAGPAGDAGWWRGPVDAVLRASDATSGVAEAALRIDGAVAGSAATVRGDGAHLLAFRSRDVAGNEEARREETVRVDATPPATAARIEGLPGRNGWWRSEVRVIVDARDATSGVAAIHIRVDDGPFRPATEVTVGEGRHEVAFFATDVAGNVAPVQVRELRVDATPPGAHLVSPEPGRVYVNNLPVASGLPHTTVLVGRKTMVADGDDGGSGLGMATFVLDGAARVAVDLGGSTGARASFDWDTTVEAFGNHTASVRFEDLAGNAQLVSVTTTTVPLSPEGALRSLDCRELLSPTGCAAVPIALDLCRQALAPDLCWLVLGPAATDAPGTLRVLPAATRTPLQDSGPRLAAR